VTGLNPVNCCFDFVGVYRRPQKAVNGKQEKGNGAERCAVFLIPWSLFLSIFIRVYLRLSAAIRFSGPLPGSGYYADAGRLLQTHAMRLPRVA
jgi:hypothetical protein